MKKGLLITSILTIIALIGCAKNEKNEGLTREDAAVLIADSLGISDKNITVADLNNDNNKDKVLAVLSRNIFGEIGPRYKFRPNDSFTRYDLARVAINTFAYLECVEDENLEPGIKANISDISNYKPMQRWYIHSALSYGFVDLTGDDSYSPDATASKTELLNTIDRIKAKSNKEAKALDEFSKQKLENFRVVPKSNIPLADQIDMYIPNADRGQRLFATSLQGIVNRDKVKMFIDMADYEWMVNFAIERSYIKSHSVPTNQIFELYNKYAKEYELKKFVVYDTKKPFTINTATDIAAAEGRLIINEQMLDDIKSLVPDGDFLMLEDLNFDSQYEAQEYTYNNYYEYLRRDVLGFSYYGSQQDFVRDYNIQMKYPVLWIPGPASEDYDIRTNTLVSNIFQNYPANIPVIGFPYAHGKVDGIDVDLGIGEFIGVDLMGCYGKYMCVFDTVGNLSYHTAFDINPENLKFKEPERSYKPYDKNKKYVAITMQESGDAPCYIQYGLKYRQWDDKGRGEIPYNYSYGLCNLDILPLLTEYFMSSATDKDYLYGAISGLGYNYPLATFGSKGVVNEDGVFMTRKDIMKDHYIKTNKVMERLGFNTMAIYGYPGMPWSEPDYVEFEELALKYMPSCKRIMADMHRPNGGTAHQKVKEALNGARYYHCATFWSTADLGGSSNVEKDKLAVEFLTKEIVSNTNVGQFFQCMAYSWHFGPRRIKLVIDNINKLYPNQYEFVNIDELDHYYLESK